jgi:hypothetical protein
MENIMSDNNNGNGDKQKPVSCGFTLPYPSINSELTLENLMEFQEHVIAHALIMYLGTHQDKTIEEATEIAHCARRMWQESQLGMILGTEQAAEFLQMKLFAPGQHCTYQSPVKHGHDDETETNVTRLDSRKENNENENKEKHKPKLTLVRSSDEKQND